MEFKIVSLKRAGQGDKFDKMYHAKLLLRSYYDVVLSKHPIEFRK